MRESVRERLEKLKKKDKVEKKAKEEPAEDEEITEERTKEESKATLDILNNNAVFRNELLIRLDILNERTETLSKVLYKIALIISGENEDKS